MSTQQTETMEIRLVRVQDELNKICTFNLQPMEATLTLLEVFFANYQSTKLLPEDKIRSLGELCFKSAEDISLTKKCIEKISDSLNEKNLTKE